MDIRLGLLVLLLAGCADESPMMCGVSFPLAHCDSPEGCMGEVKWFPAKEIVDGAWACYYPKDAP